MFNEIWQREHASASATGGTYALLMIDMDKLKDINDSFGHEAGNSAITLVAQCLQRSIRGTDTAAGSAATSSRSCCRAHRRRWPMRWSSACATTYYKTTLDLRSRMIRCTVSIGVVNYPRDGRDMRELLGTAERNMYRDKELRRAPGGATNL